MNCMMPRWIRVGGALLTSAGALGSLIHLATVLGGPDRGRAIFLFNVSMVLFLPFLAAEVNAFRRRKEDSTILFIRGLLAGIRARRRRK